MKEVRASLYLHVAATCAEPDIAALRQDFIDGSLDADTDAAFRRHLLGCPSCAVGIQNLKTLLAHDVESAETSTAAGEIVNVAVPNCPHWQLITAAMMTYRK